MQPQTKSRKQLLGVDWLCQVFRSAGFETLLAVALHGLSRKSDDGHTPTLRILANHLHGFETVHFGHHDVHQDDGNIWSCLESLNCLSTGAGGQHLHTAALEDATQGEN